MPELQPVTSAVLPVRLIPRVTSSAVLYWPNPLEFAANARSHGQEGRCPERQTIDQKCAAAYVRDHASLSSDQSALLTPSPTSPMKNSLLPFLLR